MRYELEHPVVNDSDFEVWRQYACRAWPTLMFLDPQGKMIGKHEGEITFEDFDPLIQEMVQEFDGLGVLDRSPLTYVMEQEPGSPLSFPGKVLADEASGRLIISDSNHNRIIVATLEGEVRAVVGSGEPGLSDGDFSEARFDHPQGVVLDGDILYVADTENHSVRRVDLAAKRVDTGRRDGTAGQGIPPGRRSPYVSPQLPLGPVAARRYPLHRHGRDSPALVPRSSGQNGRTLRWQRREAPVGRGPSYRLPRPAQRHHIRRR